MKRKIASRKLKRTCVCCDKHFTKGEVYYIDRSVYAMFGEVIAFEQLVCARCNYEIELKNKRRKQFVESGKCHHPISHEVWTPIVGEEWRYEPSHEECFVCGEHI